jgi:hypothetical protein
LNDQPEPSPSAAEGVAAEEGDEPSRRVAVRLPPWMAGNNILQYMNEAALKATAVDASTYRWELETRESYENRAPRLMTVEAIAGPGQAERWSVLEALPDPRIPPTLTAEQVFAERDRIMQERPGDLAAIAAALALVVGSVPHADAAAAARDAYEALATLPSGDLPPPLLPELSVKFIGVSPALMKRLALARVLMRIEEEPELLTNRPTPAPGTTAFGSGWHLTSDLALTRDAYLAPLFLAASPWIWCIPCARIPGVIVYDLGMAIVGRRGEPSELLQVFFPTGMLSGGQRPAITSTHTTAATTWWVDHMDQVLSQLSDLANYCDSSGVFVPRRLFETFMSVEQLGRRLQGILVHDRDSATRRALAFDAFDTLKGLGVIDLFEGCKLSRAERVLASLQEEMSQDAAQLLLLPAQRAVEALRRLQSGFFLPSRTTGTTVRLPDRQGNDRDWPIDEAVALYLQLLRNANHGFTPERDPNERRDQILLMAHDGDVPADIAFLPYLYWLDAVAHPELVGRRLRPRPRPRAGTSGPRI